LVKDVSSKDFKIMLEKGEGPKIGDMVLCRLNNPLGGFAAELNAAGIPTIIVGKSDFFSTVRGLIFDLQNESNRNFSLLPKTISDYYNEALRKAINIYKDREIAEKRIQPTTDALAFIASIYKKLSSAEFRKSRVISTFKAFDDFLFNRDTGLLRAVSDEGSLEDLRKSRIVCTSIHRAKGDEAARVWWLGPDLEGGGKKDDKPVAPWRIQEELNLKYVATTRAEHELYKVEYVPMSAEDFASAGDFEFADE
jgi:superfamily I DNA/RNA helicase